MMQQIDTLLLAKWIVPVEPANTALEDYALAIHQGKIKALLPANEARQQFQANETLTLDQHVLLPGLINTHTHSPMTLLRGLADDLQLMDWLKNHIWPAETELMSEEYVRDGTNLAIAEMIKSGTTCINEHYFFPTISADCLADAGMRGLVGLFVFSIKTAWSQTENEAFEKSLDILNNHPTAATVDWCWAPHSPYANSIMMLEKINQHAKDNHMRIHIHMHESRAEIENSLNDFNQRPLARFKNMGLLNEHWINVHMTQLDDEEIIWIADSGSHVVHCPESNLKLASGYCPVQKLLDRGINVSLGTDGAASNNDLDMFSELRTAALIGKTIANDPTAVSAMTAIEMATINGAKTLGLDNITGSLVIGKAADVIAINLDHLQTQPTFNPISHLVYAANSQQVTDVWVGGKQLLKNRQLITLNESEIIATAKQWREKLFNIERIIAK